MYTSRSNNNWVRDGCQRTYYSRPTTPHTHRIRKQDLVNYDSYFKNIMPVSALTVTIPRSKGPPSTAELIGRAEWNPKSHMWYCTVSWYDFTFHGILHKQLTIDELDSFNPRNDHLQYHIRHLKARSARWFLN